MTSDNLPTIAYRIDDSDIIVYVDDNWDSFARSNDAPTLTAEAVLGHSLSDFITDPAIRHLYDLLFAQARQRQKLLSVPLRCDSPDLRRYLELTIQPNAANYLSLYSRTLRVEPRDPVALLDSQTERCDKFVIICSWCKKVAVEDQWYEIEAATIHLNLLAEVPQLTHGMCQSCHDDFISLASGAKNPPN